MVSKDPEIYFFCEASLDHFRTKMANSETNVLPSLSLRNLSVIDLYVNVVHNGNTFCHKIVPRRAIDIATYRLNRPMGRCSEKESLIFY